MWLLNIKTRALELFHGAPEYAILSHRWTDNEVSFQDIQPRRYRYSGKWPPKLEGTRKKAKEQGYKYIWVDTCCINKTSSAELEEAINSMFQWYKNAAVCFAYLPDVTLGDTPLLDIEQTNFRRSSWFSRGWTLQELIAPNKLEFYDSSWKYIGSKAETSHIVESITAIPRAIIVGVKDPKQASIAQRMSWAANRVTTRKEDMAYCLLGIFGVTMPMIYGEGEKAFARLQEEIMKDSADLSILAGATVSPAKDSSLSYDLFLATLPSEFANCGGLVPCNAYNSKNRAHAALQALEHEKEYEPRTSVTDLRLKCPKFDDPETGEQFAVLSCCMEDKPDVLVGIPILTSTTEAQRTRGSTHFSLIPRAKVKLDKGAINIIGRRAGKAAFQSQPTQDWWYLQSSLESHGFKMIEFEPSTTKVANAIRMLRSGSPQEIGPLQKLSLRFRDTSTRVADDFVATLWFPRPSQSQFQCSTFLVNRHAPLKHLAEDRTNLQSSDEKVRNGSLNLNVSVSQESFDRGNFYAVSLSASPVLQFSAATQSRDGDDIRSVVHPTAEVANVAWWRKLRPHLLGLLLPIWIFSWTGWTLACISLVPLLLAAYWKHTPVIILQYMVVLYWFVRDGGIALIMEIHRGEYQYGYKTLIAVFALTFMMGYYVAYLVGL